MPEAITKRRSRSRALSSRYTEHNSGRGAGFIYGGRARIEAMRAFIPARARHVLDLGCRDGALAGALALHDAVVVGADIDRAALTAAGRARVLGPCCADLWAPVLPFRSKSFDVVLAGEIIEHVPFPQDLIAEIARVLRDGGCVVGSVPNSFRMKNRLLFLAGRWFDADPTHLRQFSPAALRMILEGSFPQVQIRPCVGRFTRLWPRMMANDLVWRAAACSASG